MNDTGEIIVRGGAVEDVEGISRVHVDSWRETYSGILDDRFFSEAAFQQRLDLWTRYLSNPPNEGKLSVATRGGHILGFANSGAAVGPDAEHGHSPARSLHLFSIYLLAAAHGSGAGQNLHDSVVGADPAQLWVLRNNGRAIAFYKRNGFDFDGAEYTDPRDPNLVELRMVR